MMNRILMTLLVMFGVACEPTTPDEPITPPDAKVTADAGTDAEPTKTDAADVAKPKD